jgi:hypothetical protein
VAWISNALATSMVYTFSNIMPRICATFHNIRKYCISPTNFVCVSYGFFLFAQWGVESNWVHSARRPLIGLL